MTFDSLLHGPRAYLILAALALALFLPGIAALPPTDRDEARFAQATRQMVETGDYINIRFQDRPRNKKPAGIHWLQAASLHAFAGGDTGAIWPYRLPSALGALAAVLALFAFSAPLVGRKTAFLAALLLATAMITVVEAHIATTDAVLLLCAVIALGALMSVYHRARSGQRAPPGHPMAFWAALGAAVLIKGPVLPFIVLLTLAALVTCDARAGLSCGLLGRLRPLPGIVLGLAIALPWFLATSVGGGGFISEAVREDLLPKLLGGQEGHGAPPGFYLALAPIAFWPGILLVPFGLLWAWRNRRDPLPRLCMAWLIPAWLAFELIPTKLVHYVLPLFPAAALMAASAVISARKWLMATLAGWPARAWLILWVLGGIVLGAATPAAALLMPAGIPAAAWAAAGAAGLILALGIVALLARRPVFAAAGPAPAMALFTALVFAAALPGVKTLWPSAAAADLVAANPSPRDSAVAAAGFHEPSLVFALGTATRLTGPQEAARHIAGTPGALALIEGRAEGTFRAALRRAGRSAVALGTVRGFNLAKGESVTLTLYRAGPAPR